MRHVALASRPLDEGQLVIHPLTYGHRDELAPHWQRAADMPIRGPLRLADEPDERVEAKAPDSTWTAFIPLLLRSISAVLPTTTLPAYRHCLKTSP